MECNSGDIMILLEKVAKKAGHIVVNTQFPLIHEKMKEACGQPFFGEQYLYKAMYLEARKLEEQGGGMLTLKDEYLEIIARYAGYENYLHFVKSLRYELPEALMNCKGEWYSYVRCNSGEMEVLVSPLRIYDKMNQVFMEMKGATRDFNGEIKMERDSLYCLLESREGKNIHLVLKIGVAKKPKVLQGVFSGLSSGGDPIAGREVLVKQEGMEFEKMKNDKLKISALINSKIEEEQIIGAYFSDKERNILKGGQASTFDLSDLKRK